jgi:hypothetical protein
MAFAIAACCVVTAWSRAALAEKVALVRPREESGVLADAFNRLQAELGIHHFDAAIVEADMGDAPVDRLAEVAQRVGALASIAFVQHGDKASVDVWLLDRVSGKTTMRRLEVGKSDDAASVLAFRAVDLLRISLQEFEPGDGPPRDVVGVDRRPVPKAVRQLAEPKAPSWRLRAQAIGVYDGANLGMAYGPALGLNRVFDRFEAGLMFAGPLLGARFESDEGSATTRQELAFIDARLNLLENERLDAGVGLGLGLHFLQAEGRAEPPLRSGSGSVFGVFASAGVHGEFFLSRVTALTLSLRASALAPRQGVKLNTDSVRLSQPLLEAAAGVVVGL